VEKIGDLFNDVWPLRDRWHAPDVAVPDPGAIDRDDLGTTSECSGVHHLAIQGAAESAVIPNDGPAATGSESPQSETASIDQYRMHRHLIVC
jgi:hypothetical protein